MHVISALAVDSLICLCLCAKNLLLPVACFFQANVSAQLWSTAYVVRAALSLAAHMSPWRRQFQDGLTFISQRCVEEMGNELGKPCSLNKTQETQQFM